MKKLLLFKSISTKISNFKNKCFIKASINCDVIEFIQTLIHRKYLIYQFMKINIKLYATSLRTFDDMLMIKFIV